MRHLFSYLHPTRQSGQRLSPRLSLTLLSGLLLLIVACQTPAPPESTGCDQVCVGDRFVTFYDEHEGSLLFGKPRTPERLIFVDTPDERLVQFFDNVRLDLDPSNGQILVANLGEWAYAGRPDQIETPPENLTIEGAFKEFYDAHNGEELFGPPLSPIMEEAGLKVQYFQNVRLEWQPGAPNGRQVAVSLLGRAQYLKEFYEPLLIAQPIDVEQLETLQVEADVRAPVLYSGETQILYITTLSPDNQPVQNATLRLTIRYADQVLEFDVPEKSDADGTVQTSLDLADIPPGEEITIEISAYWLSSTPLGSATVGFETWW